MSKNAKKSLKQLKNSAKQWVSSLRDSVEAVSSSLLRVGGLTVVMLAIAYVGVSAPEVHSDYLRSKVGSRVFRLRGTYDGRGGGTGFAIKGPSGSSYIMTNDHVCNASKDGLTMFVQDPTGAGIPRLILERSVYTDLCLLEGMPGVEGLEVGAEPKVGSTLTVVGHPRLMPLTVAKGQFIGKETVTVLLGLVSDKLLCDQPKHKKIALITILFGVEPLPGYDGPFACAEVIQDSYMSNAVIQPGNSGSPVVDFWGKVTSVAFAGDGLGWGIMVSNADLKHFLTKY